MVYQGKIKGRRQAPYPNSILDRQAFTEALEEAGISVKRIHIDSFYQALHREHYPPLPQFVENYYINERKEYVRKNGNQTPTDDEKSDKENEQDAKNEIIVAMKPLRNSVTSRKNRNKAQLPKVMLDYLATTQDFVTSTSRVKERLTSSDKSTTKLIVELYDSFVVESVLIRYDQKGAGRASLCVSSQCGCAMGCTFCATGTMGLSGNLTTGEILEQLVHADRILAEEYMSRGADQTDKKINMVRNVVFMGMGEPLDNYTNVVEACRAMIDRTRWNLAHGRVTVSTVGLISQIRRLTKELPEVSLALSLHAPNQEARTAIVPTATRYPIEKLVEALDDHMMVYIEQRRRSKKDGEAENRNVPYTAEERKKESLRRRAMIEYVMLEGATSSIECAHQLGKLCENRHLVVNLIPYNQTDVEDELRCPSTEHMQNFRDIVASYGTFCTIRRTMGADIASACGQLVQKKEQQEESGKTGALDIEDVVASKSSAGTAQTLDSPNIAIPVERHSPATGQSWIESQSVEDLDRWFRFLAVGTAVSATCFLASTALYLKRKR
ncbi:ribosomal RNA large subunit methyltransferase N 2 [Nitzschia inconspicua]|uniref:Ribosomal RNA large subunit methyltransferase N 2 n=1 Tax=Nitzschia inconspicua TaxID=303405 RepID=A0A9K3KE54_9STRA|nr:ribosomal RNA large subunit methyltransferase N 2 [Nitzschia inconspicua]